MSAVELTKQVVSTRLGPRGAENHTAMQIRLIQNGDRVHIEYETPQIKADDLSLLASGVYTSMLWCLIERQRDTLVVEAGDVSLEPTRHGSTRQQYQSRYLLITCGDWVLRLGRAVAQPLVAWRKVADVRDIDLYDKVILGPSAVAALISFMFETGMGTMYPAEHSGNARLHVFDTSRSPYPPQDVPLDWAGRCIAKRRLISCGACHRIARDRGESEHTTYRLLSRAERPLRPLAALGNAGYRNLDIGFDLCVRKPERAIVVESLMPLDSPRPGFINWQAEYLMCDRQRGDTLGGEPIRLFADPVDVISKVHGAIGRCMPALNRDPIDGDSYWYAAPLATDMSIGELLRV